MPQVGDVCKIREWDDMVREFGLDGDEDIWIAEDKIWFLSEMRPLCGEIFTVKQKLPGGSLIAYEKLFSAFCITRNMLEPYEDYMDEIDELQFDRLI